MTKYHLVVLVALIGITVACENKHTNSIKIEEGIGVEVPDTNDIAIDSIDIAVDSQKTYAFSKIQEILGNDIANEFIHILLDLNNEEPDLSMEKKYDLLSNLVNKINGESVDFDEYYNELAQDSNIQNAISPIVFNCIEECTSHYAAISPNNLKHLGIQTKLDSSFIKVMNYSFAQVESEYPTFLEFCDECFGATSNIGDKRILTFFMLALPFRDLEGPYAERLNDMRTYSLKMTLGSQYRKSKEKVIEEINQWFLLGVLREDEEKMVESYFKNIQSDTCTYEFNYVSEDYPDMHN